MSGSGGKCLLNWWSLIAQARHLWKRMYVCQRKNWIELLKRCLQSRIPGMSFSGIFGVWWSDDVKTRTAPGTRSRWYKFAASTNFTFSRRERKITNMENISARLHLHVEWAVSDGTLLTPGFFPRLQVYLSTQQDLQVAESARSNVLSWEIRHLAIYQRNI